MEKINLVELLKDCPRGMELDCLVYKNVVFDYVDDINDTFPIKCHIKLPDNKCSVCSFTTYGCINLHNYSKCVIFPKGKTTWEGFVPPCKFKDGDIIYVKDKYNQEWCSILSNYEDDKLYTYIDFCINSNRFYRNKPNILCEHKDVIEYRLATEKEKEKLFNAIKNNSYKWNPETKTLEKLIEPKFKVGDRIRLKENHNYAYTITGIREEENKYECGVTFVLRFSEQDNWELVPNKFDITTLKPFESRVLVRDGESQYWRVSFWGCLIECEFMYDTVRGIYRQCIPYEGNEHLLGKTDDCDEYYKTWK